jgi:hypothetical protein
LPWSSGKRPSKSAASAVAPALNSKYLFVRTRKEAAKLKQKKRNYPSTTAFSNSIKRKIAIAINSSL